MVCNWSFSYSQAIKLCVRFSGVCPAIPCLDLRTTLFYSFLAISTGIRGSWLTKLSAPFFKSCSIAFYFLLFSSNTIKQGRPIEFISFVDSVVLFTPGSIMIKNDYKQHVHGCTLVGWNPFRQLVPADVVYKYHPGLVKGERKDLKGWTLLTYAATRSAKL